MVIPSTGRTNIGVTTVQTAAGFCNMPDLLVVVAASRCGHVWLNFEVEPGQLHALWENGAVKGHGQCNYLVDMLNRGDIIRGKLLNQTLLGEFHHVPTENDPLGLTELGVRGERHRSTKDRR